MSTPTGSDTPRATELSIQDALRRYMQQAPLPFAITRGPKHALVYANSAFCRLASVVGDSALGVPIATAFSASDGRALVAILDRAFAEGVELLDERVSESGESASGWHCSVWPVVADDGLPDALGIQVRVSPPPEPALDLQRQVAEQMLLGALRERGFAEDAEEARRRAAFLAEAGRLLAESVDQAGTFVALARLALPTLGAWCIVDILCEDGAIRRMGIHHPNPEKQKLAETLETTWVPEPDDPFGAPAMLREARTIAITESIDAILAETARSPENLHILRQLGIGSLLTVPLVARKKLLGAITFVSAQGSVYRPEDVQLAEDLTARGALALENAQAYELALVLQRSAETANKAKSAFLGAMSHELRTPLNAIGGYIELLDMGLRGPVTAEQHADLARVKTNQQHLALLITEILNFVRVGSGGMSYAVSDVNGCDALRHAVDLIEPLIAQRGLVFDGVSGDSSIVARADPDKLAQILVNLLSNAIKFTPAGGHISAECASVDDTVTLSVIDTGSGIPPEKLEAIFEPFVQGKEGLSDRESGIGLGLAISRDLARAMKGTLTVKSTEGQGTRFTLSLPRAGDVEEKPPS